MTLIGCSQEAAPLKVTYLTASPVALSSSQVYVQPTKTPLPEISPSPDADTDKPSPSAPPLSETEIQFQWTKDIDGDGVNENIYIASQDNNEPGHNDINFFVYVKDVNNIKATYIDSADGFGTASFAKTQKGEVCLFVSIWYLDSAATFVYYFGDSSAVFKTVLDGCLTNINGTKVTIGDYVDMLGTWDYHCDYNLNNDFTLSPNTDYIIDNTQNNFLHTIKNLPVQMLIGGVYTDKTLDAGAYIYPTSTDGSKYIKFKLKDGSEGRVFVTKVNFSDYNCLFLINGISENEYFDNIDYAG